MSSQGFPLPGLGGRGYVILGGSKGLGLAVAREVVAAGGEVLLVARDPAALEAASSELGPAATHFAGDLTAEDLPHALAGEAQSRWPEGIDGALINAGGPPRGRVLELDDQTWRDSYELLLGGPIRFVRALVPVMRDGSALLFVTSSAARELVDGLDTSNVLRPAVAGLTRALASELAPRIRANSIAPGRFATARAEEGDKRRAEREGISVQEVRARAAAGIPLGRYGDPAELGRAAAFMLSPAASYINGATLHIDGGLVRSAP